MTANISSSVMQSISPEVSTMIGLFSPKANAFTTGSVSTKSSGIVQSKMPLASVAI